MIIVYAIALGYLTLVYLRRRSLWNSSSRFPLPPGPPGLPWIGNVLGIDLNAPWMTYREWAKRHGKSLLCDIIYTRLLGKDIIIINSKEVAKDLLEKRSSNNSGRPYFITSELCGMGFNTGLLPYGNRWRLHRRFFQQTFRLNAVERFMPFQHHKACQFIRQLIASPDQLDQHIVEHTTSVVINSAYNSDSLSHEDELTGIIAKLLEVAISVVRPDVAIFLETFPTVLKLPAWFPGMSFKNDVEVARQLAGNYVETAFQHFLQVMRNRDSAPSMVQDALNSINSKGIVPDESWMIGLKETSATALLVASETSHSVLLTFFLMMMLNPAVQQRAQAQIDTVVGNDRLPTADDRSSLPLVDAIFRETLRYSPIVPLSIPHAAVEDDVYRGLRIPKGAMLFTNLWAMAHDEATYPDPDAFKPERFLDDNGSLKPNDIENIAFGFGRRICPGRHFADTSIWSLIAHVLAVFKILKPLDENGVEISTEPKFTSGLVIRPVPFACRITPRLPGMGVKELDKLINASTVDA